MARHRSTSEADPRHVVLRIGSLPGSTASVLGRFVFVRPTARLGPRLREHELEHVRQYEHFGVVGFLRRYVREYLRWRWRGYPHKAAYRRVSFEVRAEWRARRRLGIGVLDSATGTPGPTRGVAVAERPLSAGVTAR